MTAHTRLDPPLVESIRKALTGNALPGETQGLSREAEREAAEFIAAVASRRRRGELALKIASTGMHALNSDVLPPAGSIRVAASVMRP